MKKPWVLIWISAIFFLTISDNAFCKSGENKAECERWCKANKPRCVKCDSNAFCDGRTLDVIKSFKRGTGNWYACGLSEYGSESLKNKNDCLQWCGQHKQDKGCESCKTTAGCGAGYAAIKMFGGRGENWYACANRDKLSQLRKQECEDWCEDHRTSINPCLKCSSKTGCGSGYRVAKRFQGEGENWNACEFISSRSQCETYCNAHKPECAFCSGNPGCGAGYTSMETFKGKDISGEFVGGLGITDSILSGIATALQKNSYACKKK